MNMAITAQQVKELRERTGAGMMECKKALTETNGDIEAAIEAMRKAGIAKAAKKATRVAAEGIIVVAMSNDNKEALILELNCETDFVARDETFKTFAEEAAKLALQHKETDIEKIATLTSDGKTLEEQRQGLIAKLGENIQLRRAAILSSEGMIGQYIHGGRIGVLVNIVNANAELAKDLAMHVAASNPQALNPEDVAKELVEKEREIFIAQAKESGKPDNIIEKMIEGRLKKFVGEVSLTGQAFVKDPNKTVAQLINEDNNKVISFVRYEVGEGIEKDTHDFASEVMAQVKG